MFHATRAFFLLHLCLLAVFGSELASRDEDPQAIAPDCSCSGSGVWSFVENLFTQDFSTNCDTQDFNDVSNHPITQILYDVVMESDLPNSTIYKNGEHVACLFNDTTFVLNSLGPIDFNLNAAGSKCFISTYRKLDAWFANQWP